MNSVEECAPRKVQRLQTKPTGILDSSFSRGPARPPDCPDRSALSSTAEEVIMAIGFKPRDADPVRHLHAFKDLSSSRVDASYIALLTFPGGVPEFSIDPRHSGDETVGLDGAKDCSCFGIDLMYLPLPILPDPKRPFGPGET